MPWDKKQSLVIWNLYVNPGMGIHRQVLMAWVHRQHAGTATGVAHTAWAWLATLGSSIGAEVWIRALEVAPLHLSFGWYYWTHSAAGHCWSWALWKHGTTQVNKPKLLGEGVWVEREGTDNRTWLLSGVDSPCLPQNHTWITFLQVKQAQSWESVQTVKIFLDISLHDL